MMAEWRRQFRDFFVSLKLTVVLIALSIILIFWATLAQTDLGIWGVQQKFFHSFFVLEKIPGTEIPVPVYPGGYFIGGLLLINLLAAQISRFTYAWRKSGIWLTHLGLILLLVGELLSGLWQENYDMALDNGETRNYAENQKDNELAIVETTDSKFDTVVSIPERLIAEGETVQHPRLPFRVVPRIYLANSSAQMRGSGPDAPLNPATQGVGRQVSVIGLPLTTKDNERNLPAAYVELIGPEGSLGTWLVSAEFPTLQAPFLSRPQTFSAAGREFNIVMRPKRRYLPFSIRLVKFSHDIYPGTDIPKNFSSRIRLMTLDGRDDREVLIYMNNPLRYGGLTFYQASFSGDSTSVLQVVRNPSWRVPYVACAMMALGLAIQFCLHLAGFVRKRRTARLAAT